MDEAQVVPRQGLEPLLRNLPVAASIIRDSRIVAANERMCALVGRSLAELLDAADPIRVFTADTDAEKLVARHQSRLEGKPEPEEYDVNVRAGDGTRIPARVRISKFPPAGPGAFLVLLTDERLRSRSAELIRAFVDVAVSAQRETTRDGMFRLVRDRLGAAGLSVNVSAIDGDYFQLVALGSRIHGGIRAVRERWPQRVPVRAFREILPAPGSFHGSLIEDLPGLVARAVGRDRRELEGTMPPTAMFCYVPVDGAPRFALSATGPGVDATAATAFGLLGQQLGASLETLRRLDELAHTNEELSLLLDLGRAALGSLDLSSVLWAGARTAARTLRCSGAYIFLPDADETALQLAAWEDPDRPADSHVGFAVPMGMRSLTSLAFSTREAQSATDAESDERIDPSIVKHFGSRSALSVPLLSHDVPRGVLTLMSRGERSFGAQDLRVATHVAQLLSVAMENARLYGEQRARAEEMTLLNEVSRSFAGALEMKPLLLAAGQTLRKLVDASNWFVLLHDPAAKVLRVAACSPEHEEYMRGVELRLDQLSLSAQVIRERRAMQAQEPLLGSEVGNQQLVDHFHERSLLIVPLIARDEVLGTVVLDDTQRVRVFSDAEMARTTGVCQQIALALLSARLYEDLRKSYAELARAQAELIERERLAALGEMAASIAHEVRNPLGVIFNSVGGLKRLLQPSGDVRLLLEMVAEEADRLNRMVGDLLEYSRPLRPAMQAVGIQAVIDEAVASVLPTRHENDIAVRISIEPGLGAVSADARLLRQALVNLLTNSVQAMPHGGVLTITAARVISDGAAQARIAVHDTGAGIPPDVRGKVFQPFFTTKPTGTGLGLAVVKRIIDGQGGRVQLAECDRGTEFHLFLPLSG